METALRSKLLEHPGFRADFDALRGVSLNPTRHAAANAHEHAQLVARRAANLAAANNCTPDQIALLTDLALAHDIGKLDGTARPERSLARLESYGVRDAELLALVAHHDTNLPWWRSARRGEAPSDRAWRKLAAAVDLRLLALFMVADRADCPGGWENNPPLSWFLEEARRRALIPAELVFGSQPGDPPSFVISAGGAVSIGPDQVLITRRRSHAYELPKGRLAWDESVEAGALREVIEETGLRDRPEITGELGVLEYRVSSSGTEALKRVHYFAMRAPPAIDAERARRDGTKETRIISRAEAADIPLVHEALRPILLRAFG